MSASIGGLLIRPPLMNSSSPWASSHEDLSNLYECPFTGAVTTRTATLSGFQEDAAIHQVAFHSESATSINSYGYSPHPLSSYIRWVGDILGRNADSRKPFIISITTNASSELREMLGIIQALRRSLSDGTSSTRVGVEINTSCPNITGQPPMSYEPTRLRPLLDVITEFVAQDEFFVVGIKLPPYVHSNQFVDVIDVLSSISPSRAESATRSSRHPIAFLTCTNTLGSCLLFNSQTLDPKANSSDFALPTIWGGMGGESIHPLSLGNVRAFTQLLQSHSEEAMRDIVVIGVGGVTSPAAVARMQEAGASVVACATILGRKGVGVFEELVKGVKGS
ncbi:hypothetical protein BOTBODRAFT_202232 [Botryobasidium botryosum FD-172 SS1]|uniref:Dihydroorotate oxidase n=1 Tax=Botryobasidium botryosum (strain FD-172 SS1) TaxID=930990 RepID=A0A067N0A4_BOTB1|nr:hypothetical protein BOTBODRAFT_202232 [Botryobasidium botryosum FD-172 SS1]